MKDSFNRREFLQRLVFLGGAVATQAKALGQGALPAVPLPKRVLGRTGAKIPVLGLGLGPLGIANFPPEELQAVVDAAIENWGSPVLVDVQWNYGQAEFNLAPLLKKRRADIFMVTKTCEQEQDKVVASIEESLQRLGIQSVDAILLNNIGQFDLERLAKPGGALAGLKILRKRGLVRHLGLSGHMLTRAFIQALERGEFDIAMFTVNFVDRHTYNFEEKVVPIARKHNVGVAAMKVLGGSAAGYERKDQRALLADSDIEPAIHYALGVPGVCTAVLGCKNVGEVYLAGQSARRYRPMSRIQQQAVLKRGKQLSKEWGEHLGDA